MVAKADRDWGTGVMTCFVEGKEVRLQFTVNKPAPDVDSFYYFKFPPNTALHVIERIRSCLYEIAATEDEETK